MLGERAPYTSVAALIIVKIRSALDASKRDIICCWRIRSSRGSADEEIVYGCNSFRLWSFFFNNIIRSPLMVL